MEYWKHDRKLNTDQTRPIYDLSRHLAAKLGTKDRNVRQMIEIGITEFFIQHDLKIIRYAQSEDQDERMADSRAVGEQ